jgi:predicted nucleic acid-binding protein
MTDSLLDSNVLIDVAAEDPVWRAWSDEQLLLAEARGNVLVNPIIYAEIARAFATEEELDQWLKPSIFRRAVLPYGAGWLAAQAFARYRKAGGTRTSPLPDFYIGAHAEVAGLTLITRDAARYRTYFPNVTLITPAPA